MEIINNTYTARIEVRYAETDQMGVVHHAVYPVWFEQARTEFFRVAGASYAQMEAEGFMSPVLELNVQYKQPTHYGEFVDVETTLVREGRVRFKFLYKVFVDGKLCTTGYTIHCMMKDGRPTRELPSGFSKFGLTGEESPT
ncbi:acyl-CoA thioesterase [Fibrobacter sp. UBA4309]|uniref:acyl-CoA thioesterase n=1 Tax=Fibrobacter sp. UBA4309 TaxID=1946537 RepID=UPI0025BEE59C|nr:thioesterase family protein [Fibrobacter sp. UBA4309]